jgi:hypothetical protein
MVLPFGHGERALGHHHAPAIGVCSGDKSDLHVRTQTRRARPLGRRSAVARLKPQGAGGRGGCPPQQRRALWRALLPARGLHVEFYQALGPRDLALDHASLIRLALIRQGKDLPHGIRPIRRLRQGMPGVHREAQDGQDPYAARSPAKIVTGVEERCGASSEASGA